MQGVQMEDARRSWLFASVCFQVVPLCSNLKQMHGKIMGLNGLCWLVFFMVVCCNMDKMDWGKCSCTHKGIGCIAQSQSVVCFVMVLLQGNAQEAVSGSNVMFGSIELSGPIQLHSNKASIEH